MFRFARHLVVAVLSSALTACATPYYFQAARGQVSLLRQRVPISEVIADANHAQTTRDQLALVLDLRAFAVAELRLPDNDSYSSYVELQRDFVVWNVIAAGEFSVAPETWCFPVAGCVAYRGYFDRDRATAFADRLRGRGFDVVIGGATAYSTLGHFDDPVLSTMLGRGEVAIAATLFHELAHQRVYIKGDTELSESFATAVEQFGVEHWLRSRNDLAGVERYASALQRQYEFAELVAEQRSWLAEAYRSTDDPNALAAVKQAGFARMRSDYEALKARWNGAGDYDAWFERDLNNATLVALTSYQRWVPGLRARLSAWGPERFYREVEALAALDPEARRDRLEAWNAESAITALTERRQLIDAGGEIASDNRLEAFWRNTKSAEAIVLAYARDR